MGDLISRKALMERVLQEEYDNDMHTDGRAKAIHHGEYKHFYKVISETPTAFDLESVIKQIGNIATDNSCKDCKYRNKCDELQEFYNPSDSVDLCALTTKHLALEILTSAANATNGKIGG